MPNSPAAHAVPPPVDPSAGGDDVAALIQELDDQRGRADAALAALRGALAPSAPEATAAQALIAAVDDLLARARAALDAVPAPQLEKARAALVERGVALAGALSRLGAVEAPPQASRPVPPPEVAPRVLSNVSAAQGVSAAGRGGKGLWVALGLAAALAAGYHGYPLATRRPPALPPTLPGAPANTFVIRQGASVVLRLQPGAAVDAGELERFTAQERARGNAVRSLASGVWAIEPAAAEGAKQP